MSDPMTETCKACGRPIDAPVHDPDYEPGLGDIERAAAAERKRLQDDAREFHRVANHPAPFERCQTAQCAALQAMLWDIDAKEALSDD